MEPRSHSFTPTTSLVLANPVAPMSPPASPVLPPSPRAVISENPSSRSLSPHRVNLPSCSAPSLRFSVTSSTLASVNVIRAIKKPVCASHRRTCMCSPTTHPGSFRCSLHKNRGGSAVLPPAIRLNMQRPAMKNSLVRLGMVEGDMLKRALATPVRPCGHRQRRRSDFQARPSRLSVVCNAGDGDI